MMPLLQGIRILEVGSIVLGPYAGQILADLGADVIKVEPLQGDFARESHPHGATVDGALFINNNRNKRSLAIDLKREEGRDVFAKLLVKSDVLLHNMRADAAERLGLTFGAVARVNPRIVYCAALGFGQSGRYRERPAYDDIIQAASGLASLCLGPDGAPAFVPTIIADKVTALHVVHGILAALLARARGFAGAIALEVPMFETMVGFLMNEHLASATFAREGAVGYPRILAANHKPFRTADGWIAVLPYTGEQWRRFLEEIGRADVCGEHWFKDARHRQARTDELYAIAAEALLLGTTDEWIAALSARDIPCSRVNSLEDLLHDAHLADVGFFHVDPSYPADISRALQQPIRFSGIEPCWDRPPPALGADTRAVLQQLGLEAAEIETLIMDEVIKVTGGPGKS
jgi:crotonobetainyl-CoA:carnitine CoA-transferase CaiB-like acyl-CoA transferase